MNRLRPKKLKWHSSLTFRLGIALAAIMILFAVSRPHLITLVYTVTGLPTESEARNLDRAQLYAETLMARVVTDSEGRAIPGEDACDLVERMLRPSGSAFLLVDSQQTVVAFSPRLRTHVGEKWPLPDREAATVRVVAVSAADDKGREREVTAFQAPLRIAGRSTGTFVLLTGLSPAQSIPVALASTKALRETPGSTAVFSGTASSDRPRTMTVANVPKRVRELRESKRRIAVISEWAISIFAGVLLAGGVALLVTRRLQALSRSVSSGDAGEIPGPFPDRGSDEIAALGRALNSMRDEIEELVAARDRRATEQRAWVAQVSHDLRTPLTALLACLDRASNIPPEDLGDLLAVARLDAERVRELAEGLLEIARLDSGESLRLEDVHPEELLGQVTRAMQPLAEADGVVVAIEIERDLPSLRADGRRLQRLLENVIRNALQHARHRVVVSARQDGNRIQLSVADDGPGFPGVSGDVPLDEVPRTNRPDTASCGIGLQIVQRIVDAHDASMRLRNLPGSGARFEVSFDLVPDIVRT